MKALGMIICLTFSVAANAGDFVAAGLRMEKVHPGEMEIGPYMEVTLDYAGEVSTILNYDKHSCEFDISALKDLPADAYEAPVTIWMWGDGSASAAGGYLQVQERTFTHESDNYRCTITLIEGPKPSLQAQ